VRLSDGRTHSVNRGEIKEDNTVVTTQGTCRRKEKDDQNEKPENQLV